MKQISISKIQKDYKKIALIGCSFLFFFFSSILPANPVYGMKLTTVMHLFDISYNFSQPSDVSVSQDGIIYVLDGVNNKIKVFNQQGKFIFSFGKKGSLDGQFKFPMGIDIDNSGKVYIADSGNHRIQVFNSTGGFIKKVKIPPKDDNPSDPTDVAVDESRNKFYVADNNNHYILSYDLSTLVLLHTLGAAGTEEREFRYPFLLALDKNQYLYISDVINTRVQVFNPEGKFVSIIGAWGVEKGNFFRPKGVAVDINNRIYVTDSYMGVIQVFKLNGDFHSVVGDYENVGVKKFIKPMGIFIDTNNRLYVVEMFAERVGVYSIRDDIEK
jgi:DNA-binding beta-propeller fold protein YncE